MSSINPFLVATSNGLERLNSGSAAKDLEFWFSHPEGDMYGNAAWGHPFKSRMFSTGAAEELMVTEMLCAKKLLRDIPTITVRGITSEFVEDDYIALTVLFTDAAGVQHEVTGYVR